MIKIDGYKPDYDNNCEVCGQSPVVQAVKDNKPVYDYEMCGVCVFGTHEALDPEWWNGEQKS